jgi:hypothetical protein
MFGDEFVDETKGYGVPGGIELILPNPAEESGVRHGMILRRQI